MERMISAEASMPVLRAGVRTSEKEETRKRSAGRRRAGRDEKR